MGAGDPDGLPRQRVLNRRRGPLLPTWRIDPLFIQLASDPAQAQALPLEPVNHRLNTSGEGVGLVLPGLSSGDRPSLLNLSSEAVTLGITQDHPTGLCSSQRLFSAFRDCLRCFKCLFSHRINPVGPFSGLLRFSCCFGGCSIRFGAVCGHLNRFYPQRQVIGQVMG